MKTRNLAISINQGDDLAFIIRINDENGPVDITGYKFLGEVRATTELDPATGSSLAVASFDFVIQDQVAKKGQVLCKLVHAKSATIPTSIADAENIQGLASPYVFSVKSKDLADVDGTPVKGILNVSPQVTQGVFT